MTGKRFETTTTLRLAVILGSFALAGLAAAQEVVPAPERIYGLGPLYSADWSPDGQWLRTDSDRGVYLWDAATGALLRQFQTDTAVGTYPSVFSYDGQWIVSGSGRTDTRVLLWNPTTGDLVRALEGADSSIRQVAISRDGTRVVASSGTTVKLWDSATGHLLHTLSTQEPAGPLDFSPDGSTLVTCDFQGQFRLWNVEGGWLMRSFTAELSSVYFVRYSPDGQTLLAGGRIAESHGAARLLDADYGAVLRRYADTTDPISAGDIDPSGTHVILGTTGQIALHDTLSTPPLHLFPILHSEPVTFLAYSRDGLRLVAAAGFASMARTWDALTYEPQHAYYGHSRFAYPASSYPDGSQFLSGALLWNTSTRALLRDYHEKDEWTALALFSPDGSLVATSCSDAAARVWDTSTGQLLQTIGPHAGSSAEPMAFSPDGTRLATGWGTDIRVWDVATGKVVRTFTGLDDLAGDVAFSPDGRWLSAAALSGPAKVWEVATGAVQASLASVQGTVTFSPASRLVLATRGYSSPPALWSVFDGRLLVQVGQPQGFVSQPAAAFSPDGLHIADNYTSDLSLQLWERKWNAGWPYETVRVFRLPKPTWSPYSPAPTTLAFSREGTRLFAGYADGSTVLWDSGLPAFTPPPPTPSPTPTPAPVLQPPFDVVTRPVQFYGLGTASSAAATPHGRFLVTGGSGGAFLWDVNGGVRVQAFLPGTAPIPPTIPSGIQPVDCSADGQRVVGGQEETVCLWDSTSGDLVDTFFGHQNTVTAVAISPDGQRILSGSADYNAILWDAETTTTPLQIFVGHTDTVSAVAFSPDGARVATGSADATARVWATATGEILHTFQHPAPVHAVAFSPDGARLLTGSDDAVARLLDIATSQTLQTFQGHTDPVLGVACSPNGQTVLTRSADNSARLWNIVTGAELQVFRADSDTLLLATYLTAGNVRVLSRSADHYTLRWWDPDPARVLQTFRGHVNGGCYAADLSPDGARVATGYSFFTGPTRKSPLRIWHATSGELLVSVPEAHNDAIDSVVFSPDGTRVLTGSNDFTAKLWDAATGTLLHTYPSSSGRVLSVTFTPDGTGVMFGSRVYDVDTGVLRFSLYPSSGETLALEFSPDASLLLVSSPQASYEGYARLFDGITGFALRSYSTLNPGRTFRFSPDLRSVLAAFAGTGGGPWLWELETGTLIRQFGAPNGLSPGTDFSPDGTRITGGSGPNGSWVAVWDAASGHPIRLYQGHGGTVYSVVYRHDGGAILSASSDGKALLWDAHLTPSPLSFLFHEGPEAWSFVSTSQFEPPTPESVPGEPGIIGLRATNNTNTFGYWESPVLDLKDFAVALGPVPLPLADSEADSVFTANFRVRSSVNDPARVPQLRVRATAENLEQSSFLAIESRTDGAASPTPEGKAYTLLLAPPPDGKRLRLAFDLLNFDPRDDPLGDLLLDSVIITRRRGLDIAGGQLLRRYTFDDGSEGWTSHAAAPFATPAFGVEPGALTVTGSTTNMFGYWSSPEINVAKAPASGNGSISSRAVDSHVLYVATFEVDSDVAAPARATVPQFRLRLNETSLHAASVVAVESRGAASRSPVEGQPQIYTVYFLPPEGLPSEAGLLAAFDYLNFDPQDSAAATLRLREVTLEAVEYPW